MSRAAGPGANLPGLGSGRAMEAARHALCSQQGRCCHPRVANYPLTQIFISRSVEVRMEEWRDGGMKRLDWFLRARPGPRLSG